MQSEGMIDVRTPAARTSDPETSHESAEFHTASGKRATQQRMVAKAVRTFPGHTSNELAAILQVHQDVPQKRLSECKTAGAVFCGDKRKCTVTGRPALTWWPKPQQPALL